MYYGRGSMSEKRYRALIDSRQTEAGIIIFRHKLIYVAYDAGDSSLQHRLP